MPAARRIGVRKFVHQRDSRATCDQCIEVHFLKKLVFVLKPFARNDLEAVEQGLRLKPPVGLDGADNDIDASFQLCSRIFQHSVGFADARSRADKNLQAAGLTFLRRAASSRASGEGRCSELRAFVAIWHSSPRAGPV